MVNFSVKIDLKWRIKCQNSYIDFNKAEHEIIF